MDGNRLNNETSPYLLQHAHNPVDWFPWGEEAFSKAEKENKLVIISIGYSACHWCHVMAHESFEDEQVAEVMNNHFVCIKVDREERPDVDKIYMEAVQLLSGQGGWPLNCVALPNGQPIWGGTYFPKETWVEVLHTIIKLHEEEPEKLVAQAQYLTNGIRQEPFVSSKADQELMDVETIVSQITRDFDAYHGGFTKAPKFPMPVVLNFLLTWSHLRKDTDTQRQVCFTLDKMYEGGIYDHLGGGFARYAVDEKWFAPHFEKMLYDNAQLIEVYSNAFKITGDKRYEQVIRQSIAFVMRELRSEQEGFYSALDADSEGQEGKYYTWTYEEVKALMGPDQRYFEYYGIQPAGNWADGRNILSIKGASNSSEEFQGAIHASNQKLFAKRQERTAPGLDDKILTAWNGLMIKSLAVAYTTLGEEIYRRQAIKSMTFLLDKLKAADGGLFRSYKNGIAKVKGFLDDYAFMVEALIALYEITFDEGYLQEAKALADYCLRYFYNPANGMFYYMPSNGEQLIARKTELQDNVIPSSVGVMVHNLLKLSRLFYLPEYDQVADTLLCTISPLAEKYGPHHAHWALLALLQQGHNREVVVMGEKAPALAFHLQQKFLPGVLFAGAIDTSNSLPLLKNRFKAGRTRIYICHNKTCQLPVETTEEALNLIV
ncbi:thioredoxin domain-containing protein [Marinilabiliaceae bacterium JC017]|nr:thioredoxin domain-containing protein [Marinilabiliaceae bacterium JC017]